MSQTPNRKQRQAEARAAKLEAFRKEQARRARNRRIAIVSAIAGGVAVIALIATVIVTAPKPVDSIAGVKSFDYTGGNHVQGTVDYAQNPPAGGEHNAVWLNCGVYDREVPKENAVHSLEHGAVWVTYRPGLEQSAIDKLKADLPDTYTVLSPYDGLPAPIVLSAWNHQLTVDTADDPRVKQFIQKYWQGPDTPEPGAACVGGLDAPGKVS